MIHCQQEEVKMLLLHKLSNATIYYFATVSFQIISPKIEINCKIVSYHFHILTVSSTEPVMMFSVPSFSCTAPHAQLQILSSWAVYTIIRHSSQPSQCQAVLVHSRITFSTFFWFLSDVSKSQLVNVDVTDLINLHTVWNFLHQYFHDWHKSFSMQLPVISKSHSGILGQESKLNLMQPNYKQKFTSAVHESIVWHKWY